MSFDLSLWSGGDARPSVEDVRRWLGQDDRIDSVEVDRHGGVVALTGIGGQPWAAVEVVDESDLDDADLAEGPAGYRSAGVHVEISYSTPDVIAVEVLRLVGDVADRFGCVVVDEQSDVAGPTAVDDLARSWRESSVQARALFERLSEQGPTGDG